MSPDDRARLERNGRFPAPGQQWVLHPSKEGPWEPIEYWPVTILDVRDEWVRYDRGPGSSNRDGRLQIDSFVEMYSLAPKEIRLPAGGDDFIAAGIAVVLALAFSALVAVGVVALAQWVPL